MFLMFCCPWEKAARTPNLQMVDLHEIFRWENWTAFQNISGDKDLISEDVGSQILNAESTSRFMASTFEIDSIVSILDALSGSMKGLQAHFRSAQECIVSKLSRGKVLMPEEILARIFTFAVGAEGENGGRQAVWLSQVSRRLRNIALQTRSLWTTLHSRDPTNRLEMSISRAGPNEEYHAFLRYDSGSKTRFMNICKPTIPRWRTLTVTQVKRRWYSDAMMPIYRDGDVSGNA
ncbi:hypothetical protein SCHPADRAFT_931882 [Schizopora paradoxa]|uniref:Uncharacterized protein n=1 Tax=Schizopora paradoxa TaxID=27342 RepID=A0A0H2R8V9_9AGAM|nr:hypothetical protein SCHPADRAFT_931882 [Schizopora paradoxa]